MKTITIIFVIFIQLGYASDNYYYKNNKKIDITLKNSVSRHSSSIDYYQNENGVILGVTDKLILKLKDEKKLKNYLDEFKITLEKTLGQNLYLLKTTNKSLTIDMANRLNEKEDVKYAHPDFIKRRISR